MQFSIIIPSIAAAAASAHYTYSNDTISAVAPFGTAPTGTGSAAPSTTAPFEGAAVANGPAMGIILGVGAAALVSSRMTEEHCELVLTSRR